MQIISGTTDFLLQGASAVAIGKFDGMRKSADCRRSYLHLILLRLFFFPEKQSKG